MGWNAQRFTVKEDVVRYDQRILAFNTSEKKLVFVLTNRGNETFTFNIHLLSLRTSMLRQYKDIGVDVLDGNSTFVGHLYTPAQGDVDLGYPRFLFVLHFLSLSVPIQVQLNTKSPASIPIKPLSIHFWVQQ